MEPGFLKPGNVWLSQLFTSAPMHFNGAGLPEARKLNQGMCAPGNASGTSMEPGFLKPGNR